jgi:hypothetical protein
MVDATLFGRKTECQVFRKALVVIELLIGGIGSASEPEFAAEAASHLFRWRRPIDSACSGRLNGDGLA